MINKNTKTILFASLIVAMILPFSMMDFVTAEELDGEKEAYSNVKGGDNANLVAILNTIR